MILCTYIHMYLLGMVNKPPDQQLHPLPFPTVHPLFINLHMYMYIEGLK